MSQGAKTALIIAGVVVGALIILSIIASLFTGWGYGGWGMMGPGMMGGFGFMWLMPIIWIVIIGLVIWAVVAAVRRSGESTTQGQAKTSSALEILKERYARGEISKEEYEQKKKDMV